MRECQPHDDVRHVDWNVTARLQSLHVRQYFEGREVIGWFLLGAARNDAKRDLTEKQSKYLDLLFHQYRNQMKGDHARLCNCKEAKIASRQDTEPYYHPVHMDGK